MADLYAAANQDSGVSSYISAASPAPSTGFGHGLGVRLTPPPTHTHLNTCMDARIIHKANRVGIHSCLCVLRVLWLLLRSLMATTEKTQVTEDGRASPLLMSQSKCWLPTDGTTWLASHRLYRALLAPCGSTHRLNIFLNPELCFAVLISLQHNVPVSPLLSSCSLKTRSSPSVIHYFLLKLRKLQKKKKKNLWGNICHLWQRHRGLFWVFLLLFYFNVICRFIMKSFKAVTDVNGERKSRARWVFVWKPFLTKEEQIQQGPFLTRARKHGRKTKMYILVVFKNKTFVILLLILT